MKVTLRELFLLTMIVALSLGWWLDRRYVAQEGKRRELEALKRVGFWMQLNAEKEAGIRHMFRGPAKE